MLGALMLGHAIQKSNRAMSTMVDWFRCDIFGKEELPTPAITVLAVVLPDLIFSSEKLNDVNFGRTICTWIECLFSQGRRQRLTFLL